MLLAAPAIADDFVIPAELSASDVALYRQIFAVQEAGRWAEADALIGQVDNPVLLGHVNFQRLMHPTDYRSSFAELREWLLQYADQPDADRIWRLALRRQPAGASASRRPKSPAVGEWRLAAAERVSGPAAAPVYRPPGRSSGDWGRVRRALAHVRGQLRRGEIDEAIVNLYDGVVISGVFDDVERALLAGDIAASAFYNGQDDVALSLAQRAATEAGRYAPEANWLAGLAAWNLGDFEAARTHFELAAQTATLATHERAGAAFWAARANLVTRHSEAVVPWLQAAAVEHHTLYGLLAGRQLGLEQPFGWDLPALTTAETDAVLDIAAVHRAIAFSQIGEDYWADREMRAVYNAAGFGIALPLMTVAAEHGMAAAALRIGRNLLNFAGLDFPGSLYPVPQWIPENGFAMDRAVLLAFMRQESAFNIRAQSVDGAHGLMQLLPSTASFVSGDASLMRENRTKLYQPEFNLDLGQRYLKHLLETAEYRDNMIYAVAAYNGGPGNMSKWMRRMGLAEDPLIFMEKIPVRETRDFVERVLANLWIYRARLGQSSPTLDSMAANVWPLYRSVDGLIQTADAPVRSSLLTSNPVIAGARTNR
jgi:soluble lytic murein transglycosylase-like protein